MNAPGRYIPDEIPKDFWQILSACQGDRTQLLPHLAKLSKDDLQRFCWNYEEAAGQISTLYYDLTEFSEDTIEDICHWVVSKGKSAYINVWDEAEDLITNSDSPFGQIQADPGLLDLALSHFKERFHEDVPRKPHTRFV